MSIITGSFPGAQGPAIEGKATFIEEKALTFTIANTGGLAVITALGLLGVHPDGFLVFWVAVGIGVLVTAVGTPWVRPSDEGPRKFELGRAVLAVAIIGAFNTAILAVSLWGSVVSLKLALEVSA